MDFPLVPKGATVNDLEWLNGHYLRYFTEFSSIQQNG